MSRKIVIPKSDNPMIDGYYSANLSDTDYEKYLSMTSDEQKEFAKRYVMVIKNNYGRS